MKLTYEKKNEMTFIGYHTEIKPDEGYIKCPEFWDKEFNEKYSRLWQTMKPETPVAVIALLKVINIISGYVKQKKWIAPHTVMNKITGALCFLLPFTLSFINLKYSAIVVCAAATFAAIQEGHYIRTGRVK